MEEKGGVSVPHQKGIKPVAQNRKAWHDYFVEEKYECGIELYGTQEIGTRKSTTKRFPRGY